MNLRQPSGCDIAKVIIREDLINKPNAYKEKVLVQLFDLTAKMSDERSKISRTIQSLRPDLMNDRNFCDDAGISYTYADKESLTIAAAIAICYIRQLNNKTG